MLSKHMHQHPGMLSLSLSLSLSPPPLPPPPPPVFLLLSFSPSLSYLLPSPLSPSSLFLPLSPLSLLPSPSSPLSTLPLVLPTLSLSPPTLSISQYRSITLKQYTCFVKTNTVPKIRIFFNSRFFLLKQSSLDHWHFPIPTKQRCVKFYVL